MRESEQVMNRVCGVCPCASEANKSFRDWNACV